MAEITTEFFLRGHYAYGDGRASGTMEGKAIKFNDNSIAGIITDTDSNRPDFQVGLDRYLVGGFHQKGFSFIKFDPCNTNFAPVYWTFEKKGDKYDGGYQFIPRCNFTEMLRATTSLQELVSMNLLSFFPFFEEDFDDLLQRARQQGATGDLIIQDAPVGSVRHQLGV